jgi:hypothetical protein
MVCFASASFSTKVLNNENIPSVPALAILAATTGGAHVAHHPCHADCH